MHTLKIEVKEKRRFYCYLWGWPISGSFPTREAASRWAEQTGQMMKKKMLAEVPREFVGRKAS